MGIPVTYDDDGHGWIDPNHIQSMADQLISPWAERVNELEDALQRTNAATSAQSQAEKVKASIIGEDERFGLASGKYRAARKWVEDVVADYAAENGIKGVISSSEALGYMDQYTRNEFAKQFPEIDIIDVTIAEDSEDLFRRALSNIAEKLTPAEPTTPNAGLDSRFQKVLNKPSSLGNQTNAKAGQLSVLERVGSLNTDDIMSLSDKQIDSLMELARKEGV
jgi:hypothetical protein